MTEAFESLEQQLKQAKKELSEAISIFNIEAKKTREILKDPKYKGLKRYDPGRKSIDDNMKNLETKCEEAKQKRERLEEQLQKAKEQTELNLIYTSQQSTIQKFFSELNSARGVSVNGGQEVVMNTFPYVYQLLKLLPENITPDKQGLLTAAFLIDIDYTVDTEANDTIKVNTHEIILSDLIKMFSKGNVDLDDVSRYIKSKDDLQKWKTVFDCNPNSESNPDTCLNVFYAANQGIEGIILTTAHYLAQNYPFTTLGKFIFLKNSIKFLEPKNEIVFPEPKNTELEFLIKMYNQWIITHSDKVKTELLGPQLLEKCESAEGVTQEELQDAHKRSIMKHLGFNQFIQICGIPQKASNVIQPVVYGIEYPNMNKDNNLEPMQIVSTSELGEMLPEIQEWIRQQTKFLEYIKTEHPDVYTFFTSDVTKSIDYYPSYLQTQLTILFEQVPRTPNMILWRGETTNWWKKEQEITDKAFTSTSLGLIAAIDYAGCCLKKIYVAKGSIAFLIPNSRGLFEILLPFKSNMTRLLNNDEKTYTMLKLFNNSGIEIKSVDINKTLEIFVFKYADTKSEDPYNSGISINDDGYDLLTRLAENGLNITLNETEASELYKDIIKSKFFDSNRQRLAHLVYQALITVLQPVSQESTRDTYIINACIKLTDYMYNLVNRQKVQQSHVINAIKHLLTLKKENPESLYSIKEDLPYDSAIIFICKFGINAEIFELIANSVKEKSILQRALDGITNSDDLLAIQKIVQSKSLIYKSIHITKTEHLELLKNKSLRLIIDTGIKIKENTVINSEILVVNTDMPVVVFDQHLKELVLNAKLDKSQSIPLGLRRLRMSENQDMEFPELSNLVELEIYGNYTQNPQELIKSTAKNTNSVINLGGMFNFPIGNLEVNNISVLRFGDAFNQDISGIYGGKITMLTLGKSFNIEITKIDYKLEYLNLYNPELIQCELPDNFKELNTLSGLVNFKDFTKRDLENYKIFTKNNQPSQVHSSGLANLVQDFKAYIQSLRHHQGNLYQHSVWTAMYMQDMLTDKDRMIDITSISDTQKTVPDFEPIRVGILSALLHDIGKGGDSATSTPVKPGHEYMGAKYLKRGLYYIRELGYINLDIMLTDLGCTSVEKIAIAMLTESHWKLGEAIISTNFVKNISNRATNNELSRSITEVIEKFINTVLNSYFEWDLSLVSSDNMYYFLEKLVMLQFMLCISDVKGATAYCMREYPLYTKGIGTPPEIFTSDCPFDETFITYKDDILKSEIPSSMQDYPYFKYKYNWLLYGDDAVYDIEKITSDILLYTNMLDKFIEKNTIDELKLLFPN